MASLKDCLDMTSIAESSSVSQNSQTSRLVRAR